MPKYSIYKLTCETGKVYIGITSRNLRTRLTEHKSHKKCMSKDFVNPTIELLEEFETDSNEEKLKREVEYINKFDCVNKIKVYFSPEEGLEKRELTLKERNKESQRKHRANLSEEQKERTREKDRERQRKYIANLSEEQKERKRESQRKYDANLSEEQKERKKERARIRYQTQKLNK
jgi:predicted GIY-YIG superfamily endonuclease